MPNTLVHLGIQSVSTKAVYRQADFKWIALGCIIPDIPWIVQRLLWLAPNTVDPYTLRLYVIVQSSFFFCLILSGALSMLVRDGRKIFLLLAANCLVHLLLDAMQVKWANGVLFFVPFSWKLSSFQFIWPEHGIIYGLTGAGFAALLYFGVKDRNTFIFFTRKRSRYIASIVLITLYFFVPYWLRTFPYQANNHYVATLRNVADRQGQYLELDRVPYRSSDKVIFTFTGERLKVQGNSPPQDAVISVQGHFSDVDTIEISAYHVHRMVRDRSSMIGLAGVMLIWLAALTRKRIIFVRKE